MGTKMGKELIAEIKELFVTGGSLRQGLNMYPEDTVMYQDENTLQSTSWAYTASFVDIHYDDMAKLMDIRFGYLVNFDPDRLDYDRPIVSRTGYRHKVKSSMYLKRLPWIADKTIDVVDSIQIENASPKGKIMENSLLGLIYQLSHDSKYVHSGAYPNLKSLYRGVFYDA